MMTMNGFKVKIHSVAFLLAAVCLMLPGLPVQCRAAGERRPFPQARSDWPGLRPSGISLEEMNRVVADHYRSWRRRYIFPSNGGTRGGYYVKMTGTNGPGNEITTSEAAGYGLIIFALGAGIDGDEQRYFNGIYRMINDHRSIVNPELMSWYITEDEDPAHDSDAATDGDLDIAYALLLAHCQWGSDGEINYLARALRLLEKGIAAGEISWTSGRTRLGDWDDDPFSSRTSDWMCGHFHTFAGTTGDPAWNALAASIYGLAEQVVSAYSPATGLLPDFVVEDPPRPAPALFLEDVTDGEYSWNACRVPLRLALDWLHYGDDRARRFLVRLLAWCRGATGGDPARITAGYRLDGRPGADYADLSFTAPLLAAATVDPQSREFLDRGWPLLAEPQGDYYGDTLTLLSLLAISGNWWRPEARRCEVTFHVAPDGDDRGPGTRALPWRTISRAAGSVPAGATVYIHGGRYYETIDVKVSGTPGNRIVFRGYGIDEVVVDGGRAPDGDDVLLKVSGRSWLGFSGLHFTNFRGRDRDGVRFDNGSSEIKFVGNRISEISFSVDPAAAADETTNARPLVVIGDDAGRPCRGITICGNEIFSCRPGYSEALALNGNVENFTVCHNLVHDIANIGIDFIGFEGLVDDTTLDQVRHGRCCGNIVYNCISPYASAAGIYVDGGRDIVIENNIVHDCQWGVEIGCEHPGRSATGIIVRDNLIYHNRAAAIACGGYDYPDGSGSVADCLIRNNTCLFNDLAREWEGEINFSHASACAVVNNIFLGTGAGPLLLASESISGNRFDYNLWYASGERAPFLAEIAGSEYDSLAAWRAVTGQGAHALALDPGLLDPGNPVSGFRLKRDSPALDRGDPGTFIAAGETDLEGRPRLAGPGIDIGADEYGNPGKKGRSGLCRGDCGRVASSSSCRGKGR